MYLQCEQEVIGTCDQWHHSNPIQSLQVKNLCGDNKCTPSTCVLHDVSKNSCNPLDVVNRIEIHMKIWFFTTSGSKYVVIYIIEGAPVCDVAYRVAEAMTAELRVHAAASVIQLFVQEFVFLQTTPFLDLGVLKWLYDLLKGHEDKMSVFSDVNDSTRWSLWPSWNQWFHILLTVMVFWPT